MTTFECSGLMNPYYFKNNKIFNKDDFKSIKHNNFILNGLSDPYQKNKEELNIEKNNNNNIDDKEKQLCKSVAWNIKENSWWINKKGSYEESLGSHCF